VSGTLVTGATGFIGSHLARRLIERGEEVRLGVLPGASHEPIRELDAPRVECDVLDQRSVRRAVKGADRVFHCAGVTSVRPRDSQRLFEVNVEGTKTVLEECHKAGVARVVMNSSAAALGPAEPGGTADETQLFTAARLGIPYVSSTRIVRNFLLGRVPMYVDGAFSVVDVRDVADGLLLAGDRGAVGERYLLGGRNFTFDRLFADLGRLSGIEPPVKVPVRAALAAASALGDRFPMRVDEIRAASQWWTYRSAKARRELGWRPRPHEETLEATVGWHLDREHDRIARTRRSQQVQYRLAGLAIGAADSAVSLASQVLRRSRLV
jgi:dihydroflavonol-4-reductase